jgi:hypothetical protein
MTDAERKLLLIVAKELQRGRFGPVEGVWAELRELIAQIENNG